MPKPPLPVMSRACAGPARQVIMAISRLAAPSRGPLHTLAMRGRSVSIAAMVPARAWSYKLQRVRRDLVSRRRPLAWGVGLWLVVIAVPYLYLYPGDNLSRQTCLWLAAMPPLAMLVAAMWSPTHLLLGIGLASQVPVLVACPELVGPRVNGAVQGLAVAVVLLGFVAATFDLATGPQWRTSPGQRLRHLLRWPVSWTGRLVMLLGVVWLAMAWVVPASVPADGIEAARTSRVAAAALCWMALRGVPLAVGPMSGPRLTSTVGRPWLNLILRRMVWLLALVGAALWWHG